MISQWELNMHQTVPFWNPCCPVQTISMAPWVHFLHGRCDEYHLPLVFFGSPVLWWSASFDSHGILTYNLCLNCIDVGFVFQWPWMALENGQLIFCYGEDQLLLTLKGINQIKCAVFSTFKSTSLVATVSVHTDQRRWGWGSSTTAIQAELAGIASRSGRGVTRGRQYSGLCRGQLGNYSGQSKACLWGHLWGQPQRWVLWFESSVSPRAPVSSL